MSAEPVAAQRDPFAELDDALDEVRSFSRMIATELDRVRPDTDRVSEMSLGRWLASERVHALLAETTAILNIHSESL